MSNTNKHIQLSRLKRRRLFCVICVLAFCFMLALPAASAENGTSFKDSNTGLCFAVPDGWKESPPLPTDDSTEKAPDNIYVEYMSADFENRSYISYHSFNLYRQLQSSPATYSLTRGPLTDESIETDPLLRLYVFPPIYEDTESSSVTYADIHWVHFTGNNKGKTISIRVNEFVHIINGYCCSFEFLNFEDSDPLIEQTLSSVTVPQPQTTGTTGSGQSAASAAQTSGSAQNSGSATTTRSSVTPDKKDRVFSNALLKGLRTTLLVSGIPIILILVFGKKGKKKKTANEKMPPAEKNTTQECGTDTARSPAGSVSQASPPPVQPQTTQSCGVSVSSGTVSQPIVWSAALSAKPTAALGGAFFIPVTKVSGVPFGNHIALDLFGEASLSKDFTYVQPNLMKMLDNGTGVPESALYADDKHYPLFKGAVQTDKVVVTDEQGKKAVLCFRSISNLLHACDINSCWITIGTIEDVIENSDADFVLIDGGTPAATTIPVSLWK